MPSSLSGRLLLRVTLVLGGTALALLLGEGLVRALGVAPGLAEIRVGDARSAYRRSANPILGFELRPNHRDPDADCRNAYASTNAHGQRDVERSLAKAAGVERVLLLGDSVVEGFGLCDLDDTISRQMEALRPGQREVLNFGVSGYCTRAEVELLETKGLAFDPDVVVLVFVENDFDDFNREAFELESGVERPAWVDGLFGGSALFRTFCVRFDWFRYGADVDPGRWNGRAIGEDNVPAGLARLRALADAHGFDPLVVVWPRFTDVAVVDPLPLPSGDELVVERLAAVRGVPVARLSPFFERDRAGRTGSPSPRLLYTQKDFMHPSAEGARVAAGAIDALLDELPERARALRERLASTPELRDDAGALALARDAGGERADRSQVYLNQGLALFERGDAEGALERFRAALGEDPACAPAHYNLANVLFGQGAVDEAMTHYEAALEADPNDARAHYNLALALSMQGEPERARPSLVDALHIDPDLADAHYLLGRMALEGGRYDEALAHLRRVLELRPELVELEDTVRALEARTGGG